MDSVRYSRAPGLIIRTEVSGVRVSVNGTDLHAGPHALGILDVFGRLLTIEEAVELLKPRLTGAQDWMDCVSTMDQLISVGALIGDGEPVRTSTISLDHHVVMLNDRVRTEGFIAAVQATVKPGDVVLDIGTGTGVLAIAAAKAGAGQVYAIEADSVAETAREMVRANGFTQRISVLQNWSTQVTIEKRADVLVAEIVGHEPLAESLLEVLLDARKRLLVPGARMSPSGLRTYALPVSIGGDPLGGRIASEAAAARWREWYDMDFHALARQRHEIAPFFVRPRVAQGWEPLSDPALLSKVDLASFTGAAVDATASIQASAAGRIDAVVEYFELDLARGITLTNDPRRAHDGCSWNVAVWTAGCPLEVESGDPLDFVYRYRVGSGGSLVQLSRGI